MVKGKGKNSFGIIMQKETILQVIVMCLFYLVHLCLNLLGTPYGHIENYIGHGHRATTANFGHYGRYDHSQWNGTQSKSTKKLA